MHFFEYTNTLLIQLENFLVQLQPELYTKKLSALNGSSIGQHTRHMIELLQELEKAYETGVVQYDKRLRQTLLENETGAAVEALHQLSASINKEDKPLQLLAAFGTAGITCKPVLTTYYRELIYNIEHLVHHMAMIRAAVQNLEGIKLPDSFGIASSTQRYQQSCAQ